MTEKNSLLVMLATYNEALNVGNMCRSLLEMDIPFDILVVDDNSPDGTGRIADELSRKNPRVKTLHRPAKSGVGSAHRDGIRWAYANGYLDLVTMDCDFTHNPKKIPEFLEFGRRFDVVIGSRYQLPDSLEDWVWYRKLLTHSAHSLVVFFLGMSFDASGAFRYYNLRKVPFEVFEKTLSDSYSFFWESLFVIWMNKFTIHEVPIALSSRTYGTSKMRFRDVLNGFLLLQRIYFRKLFRPGSFRVSARAGDHA